MPGGSGTPDPVGRGSRPPLVASQPSYRGRDEDYSPPPREDPRHVEKSFVQKLGDLARVRRGVEQSGRDVYRGEIGGFA